MPKVTINFIATTCRCTGFFLLPLAKVNSAWRDAASAAASPFDMHLLRSLDDRGLIHIKEACQQRLDFSLSR